ncbi:restriction endonuclease subunit S [Streptococcus suis]|uniref:restriction endonuclease subunit S n=1 Tax=Streptococcus suis TaxID=1307 RepID=UPI0019612F44|nr:restriction endonuclease subunit S [Streptococcus suis]MBM7283803.1 restriction endonuclease subunit S [Streptococcus suis]MCO8236599.1 restriction endonuclease subunit S [Streptococcus suis]HEM3532830.1 restriction endonuclease subunit S [Streptococcus suis]
MPNKDKNIPKRRFKAFENADAWELRKVGEICSISTGKSNTQDRDEQGKFPFYVRSPIIEKSTKYLFDEEAVLTVGDGVGTGKVFHYVNGKYDLHQRVYRMFSFTHVNAKYFYYYFSKKFFDRVMAMTAKNSVDSVRLEMISDMEITFPQLEEQEKIVKVLSTLDQQITLHQRKLDKLKHVKQAYLSEMFPAEGERVPKRRFPGFTDAWELRKLKLLFIFKYGDGNNNPSNGGPYPVFGAGGVQGGYTEYNSENSIIIGHMGDAGCVSWGEGKHFVTYNGTITRPKEEVFTAKFGYYLLSKMNLRQYRGGSGLPFLTYDMLNDMDTIVPTNKSECDKISEFFSTLDQQITLHQRKLEKLKNLKKALLNELFV